MRIALGVVTLLAVFAGCSDDRGVLVYVHLNDPNVRSVRLYIGLGSQTSTALTIQGGFQASNATYWSRDPANPVDVVHLKPDENPELLKFGVETSVDVPVVIAVGFDAANNPIAAGEVHDVLAPTASNEVYAYDLDLAGPIMDMGSSGATIQLALWGGDQAAPIDAACAGIAIGTEDPSFIVTEDDQDCDGWLTSDQTLECTPDTFNGTGLADPNTPTCLVPTVLVNNVVDQCRLGGVLCVDGQGPDPTHSCVPGTMCTVSEVCASCSTDLTVRCAANVPSVMAAHYQCTVPRKPDNTVCDTKFAFERPPTGGFTCTDLQIGDGLGSLDNQLKIGSFIVNANLSSSSATSCASELEVKGSTLQPEIHALAAFTLENHGGVALPITFAFSAAATCSSLPDQPCALVSDLDGTDAFTEGRLTACAAGWGVPVPVTTIDATGMPLHAPILGPDKREAYLTIGTTLNRLTRATLTSPWLPPVPVIATTGLAVHTPRLSADGNTMIFSVGDLAMNLPGVKLYTMTRASASTATWNPPVQLVSNLSNAAVGLTSATFAPNGTLVVAETSPTETHLYEATLTGSPPIVVTLAPSSLPLSTTGAGSIEDAPSLSPDGLHLYFESNRGLQSSTAIYVSSRRSLGALETFTRATKVMEDNVRSVGDPYVTADGLTMLFATSGGIFQATRAPL